MRRRKTMVVASSLLIAIGLLFGCAGPDSLSDVQNSTTSKKIEIISDESETTSSIQSTGGETDTTTTINAVDNDEDVSIEIDTTTTEEISTKKPEETTTKKTEQATTKKKTEQTTTKKQNTTQSTTASKKEDDYVYEDGILWPYRSQLYDDNTLKGQLEDLFWDEWGWSTFGKDKCDKMVTAIVELVYDIMATYSTDFEREKALYEAICNICSYDYESLETGLTREGQTPYGVLIEKKAVCGGYAHTFSFALTMMGIENECVTGFANNGSHAWNIVCIEGDWYEVDVTWGDNKEGYDYQYFNITTEEMSANHTRTSTARECNGTKYGHTYLAELLKDDYMADKKILNSKEEVFQYLNSLICQGKTDITLLFTDDKLRDWACEEINGGTDEGYREKYLQIDKSSEYCYFDYTTLSYTPDGAYYMGVCFDDIHNLEFGIKYVKAMDSYFKTYEEMYEYVREQHSKGKMLVTAYIDVTEEYFWDNPLDTTQFGPDYKDYVKTAPSSRNIIAVDVFFKECSS